MSNFETVGQINLQPTDELPWDFYFPPAASATEKGAIPYNTTVSTVGVVVYDSEGTDVTTDLIEGTPSVTDNVVSVTFKYPVTNGDGRYKVTFTCTLNTGSVRTFDFQRLFAKTI